MPRICVFCGSSSGFDAAYSKATIELAEEMARRGWNLVYGGSHCGLMGLVADSMLAAGREVIGVIPSSMVEREIAHTRLTDLRIVETMHERKAMMADLADAFVVLPGAYGTLDELCEILTWAQLEIHSKPIGLINVNGYWDPFLRMLDHAAHEGFLKPQNRALLIEAPTAAELLVKFFQDAVI
jgi:uncharacterized protein (TIGR00730 family)